MTEGFRVWCGELDTFSELTCYSWKVRRLTALALPYIRKEKSFGDLRDGGTPGLISNPVVKAVSADGTWGATPRESRSSPRDFSLSHLDP